MKLLQHALYVFCVLLGILLTNIYNYLYPTIYYAPALARPLKPYTIMNTLGDNASGLRVYVLSNPTCNTCEQVYSDICTNLAKHNIPFASILYPETNVDIWLNTIFDTMHNPDIKLQWMNKLQATKEKWGPFNDIHQVIKFHNIPNIFAQGIDSVESYHQTMQYMYAFTEMFGIKGIPTIAICLVLTGDIHWTDIQDTLKTLQKTHQKLLPTNRLLI